MEDNSVYTIGERERESSEMLQYYSVVRINSQQHVHVRTYAFLLIPSYNFVVILAVRSVNQSSLSFNTSKWNRNLFMLATMVTINLKDIVHKIIINMNYM